MKKPMKKVTEAEAFEDEIETEAVGKDKPSKAMSSKKAAMKGNLAKGGKKKAKKKVKSFADLRALAKSKGV